VEEAAAKLYARRKPNGMSTNKLFFVSPISGVFALSTAASLRLLLMYHAG